MATPIPPTYYYPHSYPQPQYADYGAGQQQTTMDALVDQIISGDSTKTKGKKGKAGKQDASNETKKKIPVETSYEAYTLQRQTPRVGDAKTWSKVGKLKLPFDSAKVYKDAIAHRTKSGMDASKMYDSLLINQQGVIDRILDEKRRDEKRADAVWTLFDVYKVKQDTPVGFFRTERETLRLVVTIRCQDKSKSSYTDKPAGSTANPVKFVGELIDLSQPMKAASKGGKDGDKDNGGGGKGNKKKANKNEHAEDLDEIVEVVEGGQHPDPFDALNYQQGGNNGHVPEQHVPGAYHDPNQNQGQQHYGGHDWNGQDGYGYNQQQPLPQQQWPQHNGQYNNYQQGQQGYQNHEIPPQAPMAPNPLANPFQPRIGVPEQYMDPVAEHQPYDYSPRHYSRSRSRNRSRHASRHRSATYHPRRMQTPSLGSSHDDDPWYGSGDSQFSPPRTPDSFDDAHRRGSRRPTYVREGRSLYPGEGYMLVPFAPSKRDSQQLPFHPKRRPQIVSYDDYPAARGARAIADHPAEYYEEADFIRRGRRSEGVDFLRDPFVSRQGRYDDGYYRSGRGRRSSFGR